MGREQFGFFLFLVVFFLNLIKKQEPHIKKARHESEGGPAGFHW